MSRPLLVLSEELTRYDFGVDHPMAPGRVDNTIALARELGVLDAFDVVEPPASSEALLETVHDPDYIAAVRRGEPDLRYGLGTSDNPVVPDMHEIAARVVAATVAAADAVHEGRATRAGNISGGLHHAMPGRTSGFCVYNDVAVAIRRLVEAGERVGYVDVDVHHGDGVQAIFYDDPRVLTISLHETPTMLFPGTGYPRETGGPDAPGTAVNVALPPGTGDAGWLRAFHAVVPEVLHAFGPTILITQDGCDSHLIDPLADLELSVDGQRASYLGLAELADAETGGRWVATGGGGYSITDVVPRAWTHLLGVLSDRPVDPRTPTPTAWRKRMGNGAPSSMTDGADASWAPFERGFDPGSRLDQAILATRRAVFPELGLALD